MRHKDTCLIHNMRFTQCAGGWRCPVCLLERKRRQSLYWLAKQRADRDGRPFSITMDDIVIPAVCPVLGIPIIPGVGKVTQNSPSLDRIKPERGYVPGNVRVISFRANSLKQDATVEELEKVLDDARHILQQGTR